MNFSTFKIKFLSNFSKKEEKGAPWNIRQLYPGPDYLHVYLPINQETNFDTIQQKTVWIN